MISRVSLNCKLFSCRKRVTLFKRCQAFRPFCLRLIPNFRIAEGKRHWTVIPKMAGFAFHWICMAWVLFAHVCASRNLNTRGPRSSFGMWDRELKKQIIAWGRFSMNFPPRLRRGKSDKNTVSTSIGIGGESFAPISRISFIHSFFAAAERFARGNSFWNQAWALKYFLTIFIVIKLISGKLNFNTTDTGT